MVEEGIRDGDGFWLSQTLHRLTGFAIPRAVYLAATVRSAAMLAPTSQTGFAGIVVSLTAVLVFITARTTGGGWKWRWGHEE